MNDAAQAYEDAKQLIRTAKEKGETKLTFYDDSFRALENLPPEIADLKNLESLNLHRTKITDRELKHVSSLTELRYLNLGYTKITDEALANISSLVNLNHLELQNTHLTDVGLDRIVGLSELKVLVLYYTQISDDSFDVFSKLPKLSFLALSGNRVGDKGLGRITELTELRGLVLGRTQITDKGLRHISGLRGLTRLHLAQEKISDKGLIFIENLKDMSILKLDGTQITDDGLRSISKLSAMRALSLSDTKISETGLGNIAGLKALTSLFLDGAHVSDMRPILNFQSLAEGRVRFSRIPALDYDPILKGLSAIEDDVERTRETFAYLRSVGSEWPPIQSVVPEQDDFLRVELGDDGRIDVRSARPSGAELSDTVKRKAHVRLKTRANILAQVAGNQFPRLANAARELQSSLDFPFEEIDMLEVHFGLEGLRGIYERRNEGDGEERLTQDVVAALDGVLFVGPGLVLDNEEVQKLEERRDRYRGTPSQAEIAAQDAVSTAIINNPNIFGERLRSYSQSFIAGSPQEMDRSRVGQVTLNRNALITVGTFFAGGILNGPLGVIGTESMAWLAQHFVTLSAAIPGWGAAMQVWLTPILMRAREAYQAGKYFIDR
ncbi:hypothetical protein EEB11_00385 [Pseudotabrizicola sediminis]|uniref:Leucine-rich repeat domain-containing protein n=1 Tax=Pseudotabrizicola sediminis TaxID=2486418 RepID=A0ABY2KTT5_9RHOB|nr:hypothetical protein [Pseudotabrizicola sediminis]TGD45079.1 hypothetical protein EEB11_00385 [Pseudotabrizicola sediminis]